MRFSHDRRGQSVVIGTVILFGFLIVALSLYQVQVVPQENSEVEFDHSQQVEGEIIDLRNAILSASRTGDGRPTSLKLGTRYPQRTFSLNPPPASGELSTTEPRELRIENVTVDDDNNIGSYWANRTATDDAITFYTRSLRYSPGYNEFRNGPDLVYEHSLVVAEFDTAALGRTGQTAVDSGRDRIRLTALDGEVDESGVERTSLDPETLSQSRRSVTLSATGGDPIVLELPTAVSPDRATDLEQQWGARLGENAEDVTVAGGAIRIVLDGTETYRLELGKIGLGTGTTPENESNGYITKVSSTNGVAVAEVRDRFNNPVADAAVTVVADGTEVGTERTDEDGRVSYEATDGPVDLDLYINDDTEVWESVSYDDLGAAGGTGGTGENRTFNVTWLNEEPVTVVEEGNSEQLDVEVTNRDGNLIRDSKIDYSFSPLQNGGLPSLSSTQSSDQNDGTATVNFDPNEANAGDEFDVYASAGDDVDVIRVEVIGSNEPMLGYVAGSGTDPNNNGRITFQLENTGSADATITGIRVDDTTDTPAERINNGENTEFSGASGDLSLPSNQVLEIGATSITDLDTNAVIAQGSTETFNLQQFRQVRGQSGKTNPRGMSGDNVTITLRFDDGTTTTITIESIS
ncbi:Ig-like domain-containing protein [Halorubrum sp. FL23]|uniref:Ig-like domain-containing protein n=1 Tax=Halorubrum sp. FL23 TaxID=3458704 RepID=UPI004034EFB7